MPMEAASCDGQPIGHSEGNALQHVILPLKEIGLLLDIIKTPIIVEVEVFVFSIVYYDGGISTVTLPIAFTFLSIVLVQVIDFSPTTISVCSSFLS
ncbi:hypothetical protein [Paenibacillus dendritiformis]|uniref:hypothetical protein n=1 Tax=Paenibacillus dendritiformis TaxID=130049 RepID=UPI0020C334E0|nr:hypothetical protein [Paenibacillus dendritiformis]CAH8771214.1 hypothetical protein H7S4_003949 [Paenibacillus dendritiformis]